MKKTVTLFILVFVAFTGTGFSQLEKALLEPQEVYPSATELITTEYPANAYTLDNDEIYQRMPTTYRGWEWSKKLMNTWQIIHDNDRTLQAPMPLYDRYILYPFSAPENRSINLPRIPGYKIEIKYVPLQRE